MNSLKEIYMANQNQGSLNIFEKYLTAVY